MRFSLYTRTLHIIDRNGVKETLLYFIVEVNLLLLFLYPIVIILYITFSSSLLNAISTSLKTFIVIYCIFQSDNKP